MQRERTAPRASERLEVVYTERPVSGWGGLVAMVRFFERKGLRALLESALPDGRTSPNQIPVVDLVLSLFATVLTGGRRFAHVERLRADEVVQVFIDGRANTVYSSAFYIEYLRVQTATSDWETLLHRRKVGLVLWPNLPKSKNYGPLLRELQTSQNWKPIYGDDAAVVFAHVARGREWIERSEPEGS